MTRFSRIRLAPIAAGVLLCLGLGNCECERPPCPEINPPSISCEATKKPTVDVYVDATLSMRGFVSPGESSWYCRTVQVLEDAVITGLKDGTLRFFKFGTRIQELDVPAREHNKACATSFYTDPAFFQFTYIDSVVERVDPNHLSMIITDMFQNESDLTLLLAALKDKFISRAKSIGVLGIRSEFNDTIYDIGMRQWKFDYSSGSDNSSRFRPFYMIFLGEYSDIRTYYSWLDEHLFHGYEETKFVVFSPFAACTLASIGESSLDSISNLRDNADLFPGGDCDYPVKKFAIRDIVKPAYLSISAPLHILPYRLLDNPGRLMTQVAIRRQDGTDFIPVDSIGALKIGVSTTGNSRLKLDVEINGGLFPMMGVYEFTVTIFPRRDAYILPDWFRTWNMSMEEVEEWVNDRAAFDGSKTLNINRFLQGLFDTNTLEHSSALGHFVFYVKIK